MDFIMKTRGGKIEQCSFSIDRKNRLPFYRQLADQIKAGVVSNRISAGEKLPSETTLAAKLKLSRMTVRNAYEELHRQQLVSRSRRRGTLVLSRPGGRSAVDTLAVFMSKRSAGPTPFQQEYLLGFQQECAAQGYRLTVSFLDPDEQWQDLLSARGAAFITNGLPPGPLPDCPLVVVMGWPEGGTRADWVHSDSAAGGRMAAEHLIGLGHRRLGGWTLHWWHGGIAARLRAFQETIRRANLPMNPANFPAENRDPQPDLLAAMLRRPDRPTGMFFTSDIGGIQAIAVAGELGLKVPEDLSVITYDGSPVTELARPKLTSIFADRVGTGRRAAEILIERVRGAAGPYREVLTPVELKPGASTAPPPEP